jgi:hypothetical protein
MLAIAATTNPKITDRLAAPVVPPRIKPKHTTPTSAGADAIRVKKPSRDMIFSSTKENRA